MMVHQEQHKFSYGWSAVRMVAFAGLAFLWIAGIVPAGYDHGILLPYLEISMANVPAWSVVFGSMVVGLIFRNGNVRAGILFVLVCIHYGGMIEWFSEFSQLGRRTNSDINDVIIFLRDMDEGTAGGITDRSVLENLYYPVVAGLMMELGAIIRNQTGKEMAEDAKVQSDGE